MGRKLSLVAVMVLALGALVFGSSYEFHIVSHGGPGDPFWGKVIAGMEDAAAFLNASSDDEVRVRFFGPPEYSVSEFLELLEASIAARPDGIAATMTDPDAVDEPMRHAVDLGIPLIAINTPDPRPWDERVPYLFFIGADQYLAGVTAAQQVLSTYQPTRGLVAIHEVGHIGFEMRAQGFIDTMEAAGVPVEKLATTTDPTTAVELISSYFARYPETDTAFTVGTLVSIWMIQFLEEEGLVGDVVHAAHDVHEIILNAIEEGVTLMTISQRQYFQGYLGIISLYWYQKFGFFPADDLLTGPAVIDPSNLQLVIEDQLYW